MFGFIVYMGLLDIGQLKVGEMLVVVVVIGLVGVMVGQIGKIKGCCIVGIVGGVEKCCYVVEMLGFDFCFDYCVDDFVEQLVQVCLQGIDVYYENVGGKVFDVVLLLLNIVVWVFVCGLVSGYNVIGLLDGLDCLLLLMVIIFKKCIWMQGFIIGQDYGYWIVEFQQQMGCWVQEGKIKYCEQFIDGLDQVLQVLIGLLKGENFGKVVICVVVDD